MNLLERTLLWLGACAAARAPAIAQAGEPGHANHVLRNAFLEKKTTYSYVVTPRGTAADTAAAKKDTLQYEFWTVAGTDENLSTGSRQRVVKYLIQPFPTRFTDYDGLPDVRYRSAISVGITDVIEQATRGSSPYPKKDYAPTIPGAFINANGLVVFDAPAEPTLK